MSLFRKNLSRNSNHFSNSYSIESKFFRRGIVVYNKRHALGALRTIRCCFNNGSLRCRCTPNENARRQLRFNSFLTRTKTRNRGNVDTCSEWESTRECVASGRTIYAASFVIPWPGFHLRGTSTRRFFGWKRGLEMVGLL